MHQNGGRSIIITAGRLHVFEKSVASWLSFPFHKAQISSVQVFLHNGLRWVFDVWLTVLRFAIFTLLVTDSAHIIAVNYCNNCLTGIHEPSCGRELEVLSFFKYSCLLIHSLKFHFCLSWKILDFL